jgi:hypothetical protein
LLSAEEARLLRRGARNQRADLMILYNAYGANSGWKREKERAERARRESEEREARNARREQERRAHHASDPSLTAAAAASAAAAAAAPATASAAAAPSHEAANIHAPHADADEADHPEGRTRRPSSTPVSPHGDGPRSSLPIAPAAPTVTQDDSSDASSSYMAYGRSLFRSYTSFSLRGSPQPHARSVSNAGASHTAPPHSPHSHAHAHAPRACESDAIFVQMVREMLADDKEEMEAARRR